MPLNEEKWKIHDEYHSYLHFLERKLADKYDIKRSKLLYTLQTVVDDDHSNHGIFTLLPADILMVMDDVKDPEDRKILEILLQMEKNRLVLNRVHQLVPWFVVFSGLVFPVRLMANEDIPDGEDYDYINDYDLSLYPPELIWNYRSIDCSSVLDARESFAKAMEASKQLNLLEGTTQGLESDEDIRRFNETFQQIGLRLRREDDAIVLSEGVLTPEQRKMSDEAIHVDMGCHYVPAAFLAADDVRSDDGRPSHRSVLRRRRTHP